MTQKEKLSYLIKKYKEGEYVTKTFCDEFVRIFYYEKDGSMTYKELDNLNKFTETFSRFSPYPEDVKSGFLFGEDRINQEFKELLKGWKEL